MGLLLSTIKVSVFKSTWSIELRTSFSSSWSARYRPGSSGSDNSQLITLQIMSLLAGIVHTLWAWPPIVLCKNQTPVAGWASAQFAPVISTAGLPCLGSESNRIHEVLTSSTVGCLAAKDNKIV